MKVLFWIIFIISLILSFFTIIDLVNGINYVGWDFLFVIISFSLSIGGFGYLFRKTLFKGNNFIKLILIVLVILFGVYIWPTPYKYISKISDRPSRMHRITGEIEWYYGHRWTKY